MKVFNKKSVTALALTGLLTLTCAGFMGSAATAEPIEAEESAVSVTENTAQAELLSTNAVSTPKVLVGWVDQNGDNYYYTKHNCFVSYAIQNTHEHTVDICMGKNNTTNKVYVYNNVAPDATATYISLPSYASTSASGSSSTAQLCTPSLYNIMAYCPTCNANSGVDSTMFNNVAYAYDSVCKKGYSGCRISGSIPTSYDQSGTVWTHNSSKTEIYYSLAYKGTIIDDSIVSPSLGTKTNTHVIDGITFSVRTGPNKISIKASNSVGCNYYDTMFAVYW